MGQSHSKTPLMLCRSPEGSLLCRRLISTFTGKRATLELTLVRAIQVDAIARLAIA
jgi:hypothetical protein